MDEYGKDFIQAMEKLEDYDRRRFWREERKFRPMVYVGWTFWACVAGGVALWIYTIWEVTK